MTAESWFSLASASVLPGWALLVLLPRWRPGLWIAGLALPAALSVLYATLFALHFGGSEGGFGSLREVATLFGDPWLLLVGWVHYLAFDLFVGAWEVRDAQRSALPHLAIVPVLILTFLAGPVGLLCYLLLRGLWKKRWQIDETSAAGS